MTDRRLHDWTEGQAGIVAHQCDACHKRFYFERPFCPRCGSTALTSSQSSGVGTVEACTLLYRAPTDALRPYAPYLIALVALDDGFTVMGHGDRTVAIGHRVRADFISFGDQPTIPFFVLLGAGDD